MNTVRFILLLIVVGISGYFINPILDDFGPLYSEGFKFILFTLFFIYFLSIEFRKDDWRCI